MIVIRSITDPHPPAPDVYFSASYAPACEIETVGTWLSLDSPEGAWQLPVVLSPIPGSPGHFDAASPYGYSGVYADPSLSVDKQRELWDESIEELRSAGVVSLFLRHSSLVPTAELAIMGEFTYVVKDHPTVAVDIADEEVMWAALAGRARTAVRKARKNGLDVRVRAATVGDCADGSVFRALYDSSMARVDAAQRYNFSREYYEALLEGLGDDLLIVEVHDYDNIVSAAALLMRSGTKLHYHLSGSYPDGARLGANNLMLWGAMAWAANRSLTTFHLGGGVSADDALLRFKRSFGGRVLGFSATGHVVNPDHYAYLTTQRPPIGGSAVSSFFPPYRRSLS